MTRLYFPHEIPAHGALVVPAASAHHLMNVLRVRAGETITLFDGRGREYDARVDRVDRAGVALNIGEARAVDRESPLDVLLAQGISSGERMDYTIRKAVELGAVAIQPLATERSVVRLNDVRAAKRSAHWQAIVTAACEQCGRNRIPQVLAVKPISSWLATMNEGLRLTLSPGAAKTLREIDKPHARVTLLVGPEGGLSARERDDAEAAGFASVSLGPRILRTETAALAAIASMQTLWGDF